MTPDQRADAVVESFCEKSPLPKNDAIVLRSSIAQVLKVVADEKDKEIAELKAKLEIVHGTAREVLKEGDRQ